MGVFCGLDWVEREGREGGGWVGRGKAREGASTRTRGKGSLSRVGLDTREEEEEEDAGMPLAKTRREGKGREGGRGPIHLNLTLGGLCSSPPDGVTAPRAL